MRVITVAAVVLLAGLAGVVVAAQDAATTLSQQEGIRLMRAVNTTENQIKGGSGNYAALADVVSHRSFSPGTAAPLSRGSDDATVKGYRLMVVRSSDGQHYQASVTPLAGGGSAWFTDERGMIFVGQPIQPIQ